MWGGRGGLPPFISFNVIEAQALGNLFLFFLWGFFFLLLLSLSVSNGEVYLPNESHFGFKYVRKGFALSR